MKTHTFQKSVKLDFPVSTVFSFHERPGALNRMVPPWDPLQVIKSDYSIKNGSQSLLKMNLGPFSYNWLAEHHNYNKNNQFQDIQKKGPLSYWCHTHKFKSIDRNISELTDQIDYRLPGFGIGDIIMGNNIKDMLQRIFRYRHRTLTRDLKIHQQAESESLNILISGASGVLGSVLMPFLTTGGHHVLQLVRSKNNLQKNQVYWDPINQQIDGNKLNDIDVVIHLAGENIGEGRWTPRKKKSIIDSRVNTTQLLVETMKRMPKKPKVFLSASAIGYYGNRSEKHLTESASPGTDFISEVCNIWEKNALQAEQFGIRTCLLRIGVVLTPLGGALARLYWLFKLGLGARLGDGSQYLSWVGIDDALYSIYHLIFNHEIEGPVNIVSPYPVTNQAFSDILAEIFNRKANKNIPAWVLQKIFGQMGEEIVLSSTHVKPAILEKSHFNFRQPDLKTYLQEQFGLI